MIVFLLLIAFYVLIRNEFVHNLLQKFINKEDYSRYDDLPSYYDMVFKYPFDWSTKFEYWIKK